MNRAVLFCLAAAGLPAQPLRVLDGETGAPVLGAMVTAAQGRADVCAAEGETILVRASRYRRSELRAAGAAAEVRLTPIRPKALYLTPLGLANRSLREPVLDLLEQTEINALVIDVKGDRGWIAYPSSVPLAGETGAVRQSLAANTEHIERLRAKAVYRMLYPSGFQYGIPGYRMAAAHAYEIVRLSLERAVQRVPIDRLRFRPWLQAFQDYAFDRRAYGPQQIRAQIRAAEKFGTDGWMIWNLRNIYPRSAFRSE